MYERSIVLEQSMSLNKKLTSCEPGLRNANGLDSLELTKQHACAILLSYWNGRAATMYTT